LVDGCSLAIFKGLKCNYHYNRPDVRCEVVGMDQPSIIRVPLISLEVSVNATIRNLSRTQDVTHRREPAPSLVKLQLDIPRQ